VDATFEPDSFLRAGLTGVRPFEGTSLAFGDDAFGAVLRMLRRERRAEVVVEPTLVLTEEEPGSITSLVSLPQVLVERSGGDSSVTTEAVETGVRLDARAVKVGRDRVTLEITAWIRLAEPAAGPDQDPRTLVLRTREVTTQVTLRDREAALVGGLKIRRRLGERRAPPFLAGLPALAPLASSRLGEVEETDLVLLVRAEILVRGR
jgi:protein transport protein HofQ/type IV pilus assembly protein PilQ